jgi:hypothetical protein
MDVEPEKKLEKPAKPALLAQDAIKTIQICQSPQVKTLYLDK